MTCWPPKDAAICGPMSTSPATTTTTAPISSAGTRRAYPTTASVTTGKTRSADQDWAANAPATPALITSASHQREKPRKRVAASPRPRANVNTPDAPTAEKLPRVDPGLKSDRTSAGKTLWTRDLVPATSATSATAIAATATPAAIAAPRTVLMPSGEEAKRADMTYATTNHAGPRTAAQTDEVAGYCVRVSTRSGIAVLPTA